MVILNQIISKKDLCLSLLFATTFFLIPFNEFGCLRNQLLCVVAILCSLFSSKEVSIYQLAYFLPYISATAFPMFGISLHTISILELILLVRIGVENKTAMGTYIKIVVYAFFSQIVPLIAFDLSFTNVMKLALCALLFYTTFVMMSQDKVSERFVLLSLTLGVLTSCVAGMYYKSPVSDVYDMDIFWMRYKGLWTDPNFLGMFCLIGIITLFHIKTNSKLFRLVSFAGIAALFYFATLTMSRTFLLMTVVCVAIIGVRSLKKFNSTTILIIIMAIFFIPYFLGVVEHIMDIRMDTEGGVGNGRSLRTMLVLEVFFSNPLSLIFGIGFDNMNFLPSQGQDFTATHNTVADVVTHLGFLGLLIVIGKVKTSKTYITRFVKYLFTEEGMPFMVILLYGTSLSLLPYEFTYVVAALTISLFIKKQNYDVY